MTRIYVALLVVFVSLGFILAETAALKGNLSVSGTPIRDIDVTLKKVPGQALFSTTTTDGRGNFEFQDIPEGDFHVETGYFELAGPESVLSGKFMYFNDPLDEALIKIINENKEVIETATTDEKGRFSVSGLDATEVKLIISGISGTTPTGM